MLGNNRDEWEKKSASVMVEYHNPWLANTGNEGLVPVTEIRKKNRRPN